MSYVFLSHNESSRELAERVHAQLDALGILTWVRDTNIDWTQEENVAILNKAVQAASALLVIVPGDNSDVGDLSQDTHLGYQFAKPVLMLRNFEELPAILQRLGKLVPERAEFSPLPQPISDDERISSSFLARNSGWLVAALLASFLVAGAIFVLFWQQRSVSTIESLPSPSLTSAPVVAATETQVAVAVVASVTPTPSQPAATNTIALSATPTLIVASVTLTASPLPTTAPITPSATATSLPTATDTATLVASSTPSTTPSQVPTLTLTHSPTLTPTLTFTATALPATALPPATLVATAVELTATASATETPSGCPVPAGWVAYTVISGDTVFSIATRVNSNVATLRTGNCLVDADVISIGQTLYLPPLTTATPSPTTVVVVVEGCTTPGVIVTAPLAGTAINGIVEVRGTANIPDLASYRLEIRSAAQQGFTEVVRVTQPVVNDVLWRLDTDAYPAGIYDLRLIVLSRRGVVSQPCIIPVVFE